MLGIRQRCRGTDEVMAAFAFSAEVQKCRLAISYNENYGETFWGEP
jgi:hypothetical protein